MAGFIGQNDNTKPNTPNLYTTWYYTCSLFFD